MIYIDTSRESTRKVITKWCRENGYIFDFNADSKERMYVVYPFRIFAPSSKEEEIREIVDRHEGKI
ncbi:MAG: hypothetical protein IJI83_02970 [Oscillospiraceae bacterium]|nr:hypothetical protein [Oscillospiraceae bacterium]